MTAAQNKPLLVSKEWLWLYASKKRLPIIGEPQIAKESQGDQSSQSFSGYRPFSRRAARALTTVGLSSL